MSNQGTARIIFRNSEYVVLKAVNEATYTKWLDNTSKPLHGVGGIVTVNEADILYTVYTAASA